MLRPLPYIGGKNRLAKQIVALLPEHRTYVEPFCGGGLLFHLPPAPVEVINDRDAELINFFRCLQWHYEEVIRYLRYCLISRKLHNWHIRTDPAVLTDIQRAGRLFFLQKASWGGLIRKQTYHYAVSERPNLNPKRIPEIIESAHRRLQNVQIECLPYQDILTRFDREETFFFIDPPYWGPQLYNYNFRPEDFVLLAERLLKLRGKFILTLNDRAEVRQAFADFQIRPIELAYSAVRQTGKRYKELLIMNFQPPLLSG